jgi:hypothetical protein
MADHPCLGVCLRRPVPLLQKVVKQNKADHTAQYNTPHGCGADIPALVLCPWRRCGFVTGVALRSGWSRFLVGEGKPIEPVKRAAWLVGLGSASWRARYTALGPSLALGRALLGRGATSQSQPLWYKTPPSLPPSRPRRSRLTPPLLALPRVPWQHYKYCCTVQHPSRPVAP